MLSEREIAESLLQINAIKLNVKEPFTWASGLLSPIYCDNRRILSFPGLRGQVADSLTSLIRAAYGDVELIAGVATGAIAPGVLVAERMNLPFVYVRSNPKAHGLGARIEGHAEAGLKTVVVEDLISTAKSSISACNVLQHHGLPVLGMAAIFTYGLDAAAGNLAKEGCRLQTLSSYAALLEMATIKNIIGKDELMELKKWRSDPEAWSDNRKG